mmetsp:Transcript_37317/g.78702  ORF Transcript_37317/g.78702 Transcript_37317/m.78702 type:complete len:288 (-) Transcript_37317:365-1228(-)
MVNETNATHVIKRIFAQYCIDKGLDEHQAYLLSLERQSSITQKVSGLRKFSYNQLKSSLRALRSDTAKMNSASSNTTPKRKAAATDEPLFGNAPRPSANEMGGSVFGNTPKKGKPFPFTTQSPCSHSFASAGGTSHGIPTTAYASGNGMDCAESMSALSIGTAPYENYKFNSFEDYEDLGGDLAKRIVSDPTAYQHELNKAQTSSVPELLRTAQLISVAQGKFDKVRRMIKEDNKAHDHLIAISDRDVVMKRVELEAAKHELEAAERHNCYLKQRKWRSTGKMEAYI